MFEGFYIFTSIPAFPLLQSDLRFWSPCKGLAAPSWWTWSVPAACPCFRGGGTLWRAQSHLPRCLCARKRPALARTTLEPGGKKNKTKQKNLHGSNQPARIVRLFWAHQTGKKSFTLERNNILFFLSHYSTVSLHHWQRKSNFLYVSGGRSNFQNIFDPAWASEVHIKKANHGR